MSLLVFPLQALLVSLLPVSLFLVCINVPGAMCQCSLSYIIVPYVSVPYVSVSCVSVPYVSVPYVSVPFVFLLLLFQLIEVFARQCLQL